MVPTPEENAALVMGGFITLQQVYDIAKKEGKTDYILVPFDTGMPRLFDGCIAVNFDDEKKALWLFG